MFRKYKMRLGWVVLGILLSIHPSLHGYTGPIEWAQRVVESTMRRYPSSTLLGDGAWQYWNGFYLLGQYRVWETTKQASYFQYVKNWIDAHVDANGNINQAIEQLNHCQPGLVTLLMYIETGSQKYKLAADRIRNVLKTFPKTSDGGFWQAINNVGVGELWLDGLYMALPFLVNYGQTFGDASCFTESANQIIIYANHLKAPSGLLYHAYDEDCSESWADPVTHHSPFFWGRAMGWYGMALVEVLDCIPNDHPKRPEVIQILTDLVVGLSQVQDPITGLWYQVVDKGDRPDNWLETSCSCMYAYFIARAVEKGYVNSGYLNMAQKAYDGILQNKMSIGSDGLTYLKDISSGTGASGNYSDYVNPNKKSTNDLHGLGAFLMMCWEMAKFNRPPSVALTSPNNTSYFWPNTDIGITANATDSDGNVVRVDFFKDSNLLYSDNQSPWEYTWQNVPEGSYILTAVAKDDDNAVTNSSPVHIVVTDDSIFCEAETGFISQGSVDTNIPGYTGTGFVNLANQTGTYLELTFSLPKTGTWNQYIRYVNGSSNNRPCQIRMDGQIVKDSYNFLPTGDWTIWKYSEPICICLASGIHTLRITGSTSESAPNIDHVKFLTVLGYAPVIFGGTNPANYPLNLMLSFSKVDGANSYNIYRGTSATFTPDQTNGSNRIASGVVDQDLGMTGIQWMDMENVIGDPSVNHFYSVTAVNGGIESAPSSYFGEFEFSLITTPKTDFNEIALSLNIFGVTNAQELMAAVPNCNSIARWNASLQGYEQYIPGIPPTNFPVQIGYPYYVNVTSNGIFTMLGGLTDPTYNLITTAKTDFNDVMLPLDKTGITKASQLMADIPGCNSVARWNASMQGYEQYIPGIPPTDFDVRVGYPYYVNVTSNVTWPTGGTPKMAIPEREIAQNIEGTKTPHAVCGNIDWGTKPEENIGFVAYVISRPEDRLTEDSPGCRLVDGYWIVQCAAFRSPWKEGEVVKVDFLDKKGSVQRVIEVSLTYEPYDIVGEPVSEKPIAITTGCKLFQNYPNPFNTSTTIEYQIPRYEKVTVAIYNMGGQKIRTLVEEEQSAGSYKTIWSGSDEVGHMAPSGIYFMRLETEGFVHTQKILMLK
jgi:unsaturated rhamnogalacturonyl hydrolase